MTVKQKLEVLRLVVTSIENDLIDPASGGWKVQPDYADDASLIQDIEAAYKSEGPIEPNVDKAIAGVVAILKIL